MRTELLDFVRQQNLGKFRVDTALPRTESGDSLVTRNPGRIYVDTESISETPLINTLGGMRISSKTTSVTVAFATDSKQLSANYSELVQNLLKGRDIGNGFNSRDSEVTTSYENDLLITEIEFSYTILI